MMFSVEVNSGPIQDMWEQIGLNENEVQQRYKNMDQLFQNVVQQILNETSRELEKLKVQALAKEREVQEYFTKFELDETNYDALDTSLPLKQRIEKADQLITTLHEETQEMENEYNEVFKDLTDCFDILEISDRGEFAEPGDNYGDERLNRMNQQLNELKDEIKEREQEMDKLCDEVAQLHQILGLDDFVQPDTLGDPTFDRLEGEKDILLQTQKKNQDEILLLIKEIRKIETILRIKPLTSGKVTEFSQTKIDKLRSRLDDLEREKETKIPEVIAEYKQRLPELWEELHIHPPSPEQFPFFYNSPPNKRTLIALETEVNQLQLWKEANQQMLDLITRREAILADYQRINNIQNDPNRLTSRRSGPASSLLEEERIRKTMTIELPKIHAKLIPLLQDYENTYEEPYIRDDVYLLEEVTDQYKQEQATQLQEKVKKAKRRSPMKNKFNKPTANLSQRAPFQLQEYMI